MKEDGIHFYGSLCSVPYFNWIFFIISHLDILGCLSVFHSCSTLALKINIIRHLSWIFTCYFLMMHQCQTSDYKCIVMLILALEHFFALEILINHVK